MRRLDAAGHCGPRFRIVLEHPAPPQEVWRRLWDLERHTRAVPFTGVALDSPGSGLAQGRGFTARTSLGPLAVDDRMTVREWDPPRRAVVVKTGPVLTGTITVTVLPTRHGSAVLWEQDFGARGVPAWAAALTSPLVRAGYRRALRRILG